MSYNFYCGDSEGQLTKLDSNGNHIWTETNSEGQILHIVVDSQGNIYHHTGVGSGSVIKKRNSSGGLVWTYSNVSANVSNLSVNANGEVYFTIGNDLTKLNSDGTEAWTEEDWVGTNAINGINVDQDGYLYAVTTHGVRTIVKADSDGTIIENRSYQAARNDIAVTNNDAIYTSYSSTIIEKYNKTLNWRWENSSNTDTIRDLSTDADHYIYSGASDGNVKKIDSSGTEIWNYPHDYQVRQIEVNPDGEIILSNTNDQAVKVDSSGNFVWEYEPPNLGGTYDHLWSISADPGRVGPGFWGTATSDVIISIPKESISTNSYNPNVHTPVELPKMERVVYQQRHDPADAYDTDLINYLEGLGLTVTTIIGDISGHDFSNEDLLIVGAPGTGYTSNPSSTFISNLDIPVISFCRHTSRNVFNMGDASGSHDISSFLVKDDSHEICTNLGLNNNDSITLSTADEITSHGLWSLSEETNFIMEAEGYSDRSGLAERLIDGYPKIHYGFHRFDVKTTAGEDVFLSTLEYLGYEDSTAINISLTKETVSVNTHIPSVKITKNTSLSLPKQSISINEYPINTSSTKNMSLILNKQIISTNIYNPSLFETSPHVTIYLNKQNITTNIYNPTIFAIQPNVIISLTKQDISLNSFNPEILTETNRILQITKQEIAVYTKPLELSLVVRGRLLFRGKVWSQNPDDPIL